MFVKSILKKKTVRNEEKSNKPQATAHGLGLNRQSIWNVTFKLPITDIIKYKHKWMWYGYRQTFSTFDVHLSVKPYNNTHNVKLEISQDSVVTNIGCNSFLLLC